MCCVVCKGIKTLEILSRPGSYEHLEKITSRLINGIIAAGKEHGHAVCGGSISGLCVDAFNIDGSIDTNSIPINFVMKQSKFT